MRYVLTRDGRVGEITNVQEHNDNNTANYFVKFENDDKVYSNTELDIINLADTKEDLMKILVIKSKHLEFIPAALVTGTKENPVDPHAIYVVSHKYNNRIYKKRGTTVGAVFLHKTTKKPSFVMAEKTCLSSDSLLGIALFMHKIEIGEIEFNFETGGFKK